MGVQKKNVPVLSWGFLFDDTERTMVGEGSISAREPCTELARAQQVGLAAARGVDGRQQRLAWGLRADF